MRYFLVKLELETGLNSVKYIYPDWLTFKSKIINCSNTTPADSFVDIVIITDIESEIEIAQANGIELTVEQFGNWKSTKELILKSQSKKLY